MPLNTPTSVHGSNYRRVKRIAIIEIETVYQAHPNARDGLTAKGYSVPILENELLQLTLNPNTARWAKRALSHSAVTTRPPEEVVTADAMEMIAFLSDLKEAINQVWQHAPFNDPNLIIYGAGRLRYHAGTLAIEIEYRDPT